MIILTCIYTQYSSQNIYLNIYYNINYKINTNKTLIKKSMEKLKKY